MLIPPLSIKNTLVYISVTNDKYKYFCIIFGILTKSNLKIGLTDFLESCSYVTNKDIDVIFFFNFKELNDQFYVLTSKMYIYLLFQRYRGCFLQ